MSVRICFCFSVLFWILASGFWLSRSHLIFNILTLYIVFINLFVFFHRVFKIMVYIDWLLAFWHSAFWISPFP